MKRRNFSKIVVLGSCSFYFPNLGFTQEPKIQYEFKTLQESFRAIGFDSSKEGNSFFVVTADVHYGSDGDGMMMIINEVNEMKPAPSFLCINGDLIVNASSHFGHIPDEKQQKKAIEEFRIFKMDIDKLDKNIPIKLTLGNHDTHPGEVEPKLFWKVFPNYPAYQSMDLEGVHHIFLNGHSTGYIDAEQMVWLEKDVSSIPTTCEVVIFVHQPSMSHRVRERGIPAAISKAFENHKGRIWLIGGHEHTNSQEIFQFKNTELIEHGITCGTAGIWGGPEKPGYWIYCLEGKQVAGRIFRQRSLGYRLEPMPEIKNSKAVPMPFDNCCDIEWQLLVGENAHEYLIESKAENCLNYWAYVKELTYALPLGKTKKPATKIAMLTDYKSVDINKLEQYFISSDLKNWMEISINETKEDILVFDIPLKFQNTETTYFKFKPIGEAAVAGLALLS